MTNIFGLSDQEIKEIWYEWLSFRGLADYMYMNNAHIYNAYWYEKQ